MNNQAKALFFDYLGSKFGMWHDGILDEYKQYNISPDQEAQWHKELIALWQERLSANDLSPVITLSRLNASETLPDILKFADQGDSYAQLIYANALWEITTASEHPAVSPEIIEQAQRTAIRLWRSIATGPIELAPNRDFRPFDGSKTEDFLKDWAARNLARVKENLT